MKSKFSPAKNFSLFVSTTFLLFVFATQNFAADNARFVNPFIGTAGGGHTYPGATTPFGLVQISPDTGNIGWNYCSGYHYEDTNILGFSHTHLSGTGWMDLGDLRLLPFTGEIRQAHYRSKFSHQNETASPGYYSVKLDDYGVKVELAATARCAFHHYTFSTNAAHLLVDLRYGIVPDEKGLGWHVVKSEIHLENPQTASGYLLTQGWGGDRHVYFALNFDQPVASTDWLTDSNAMRNQRLVFNFAGQKNLILQVKVGISTVDVQGAKNNLAKELPDWNFNAVKKSARAEWNPYLSAVQISGTKAQEEIFYTALYHTLVVPNNIADADGRYRGADNKIYTSPTKTYYSTFSLWDTFRATDPFYTILYPNVLSKIVQTMLAHFDVQGFLPIWTLWGHENYCMIANHAIPIIADAYLKGIGGFDGERAFHAMKISSTVNHQKSDWDKYERYGYLPSNLIKEESVSRALESDYDDWCVAQMAKAMGKTNDYERFTKRAHFYRNLFDSTTDLMRGKNSDGSWVTPFDPLKISHAGDAGGDYTEGNAWQYTWQVQQAPEDLIRLMGGDEKFVARLDKLFSLPSTVYGDGATVDVTGLIGQYDHGNEPCHHVAYLYSYAGQPWKTAERVHEIIQKFYNATPDGLCGNDDCGQMSAWYLFSVLGFYPVNPAGRIYVFGSPALPKAVLHLQNGKTFTIKTVRKNSSDIYINRVELNGKPYSRSYLFHRDIMNGGTLKFFMSDKPNYDFGKSPANRPQAANE